MRLEGVPAAFLYLLMILSGLSAPREETAVEERTSANAIATLFINNLRATPSLNRMQAAARNCKVLLSGSPACAINLNPSPYPFVKRTRKPPVMCEGSLKVAGGY